MRKKMIGTRLAVTTAAAVTLLMTAVVTSSVALAQNLDFETYKTRVEPIFLKKRPGHARCVVCHEANNSAFRLQPKPADGATWTEEQSRRNFENVSHLVKPGDPMASKLLIHPLAPDAGGDEFHGGGWQFVSQKDADWMAIAGWVRSAK
jgi:uncharacterized membrane protein YcjF (UPF0283 family)